MWSWYDYSMPPIRQLRMYEVGRYFMQHKFVVKRCQNKRRK